MIPVAGVFISLIPLSIIAYNKGGITDIVIMLVMIAVLHALETYVLNPKFIQAKTNLPAFYVFVILIISEHLIGPWGLIIGIPLFIFFVDLIQNDPNEKIKDA
jgi:predicted PurR-regulated permease PerM